MIVKDFKEKRKMEDHVPVPRRVYIAREDLETARQARTENCRRRIE